jgi:hypothetical protein
MAACLLPANHLADVLAGERIVLPAWQEQANSIDVVTGGTIAGKSVVSGRKVFIYLAAGADAFLVAIPSGLALVERSAPGVHLEMVQTRDGGNTGTPTLMYAPAELFPGNAAATLETAILALRADPVRV